MGNDNDDDGVERGVGTGKREEWWRAEGREGPTKRGRDGW